MTGYIDDDTPPLYSRYHRSKADLYMYYQEYFKQGIVACIERDSTSHDEKAEEVMLKMMCSGVWEMKNDAKATKQLYANMLHAGYQMIVKALKEGEVIDVMVVYGLLVNYEKKIRWLYKLTVNFTITETINIHVHTHTCTYLILFCLCTFVAMTHRVGYLFQLVGSITNGWHCNMVCQLLCTPRLKHTTVELTGQWFQGHGIQKTCF